MMSKKDIKYADLFKFWSEFYAQIREWAGKDKFDKLYDDYSNKIISHEEMMTKEQELKNSVIKKYISSTHTWVQGKCRWSKKINNWYEYPLECSVCKMGASAWDKSAFSEFNEKTNLPSQDMHGNYIYRTCQEVQDAKKKHKGTKCLQCGTFNCIDNDY